MAANGGQPRLYPWETTRLDYIWCRQGRASKPSAMTIKLTSMLISYMSFRRGLIGKPFPRIYSIGVMED